MRFMIVKDNFFSLGLSYYEVMELDRDDLDKFLFNAYREEIIDWLQWNDPNGIYLDKLSLSEFGEILSKEEGIEIIKKQLHDA